MKELPIYSKQTVEFVTVAAEYCGFIEKAGEFDRHNFVDKCVKLLPLLYLKATLLPQVDYLLEEELEKFVSEEMYEYLRSRLAALFGAKDDYMEVFDQDMQYSEAPIPASIAEDLTEIYQDIKDFISVFSMENESTMNDSLALLNENFRTYWGQKLVNVMRPLHTICFMENDTDEDSEQEENYDELSENTIFDSLKDDISEDEIDRWNG